MIYIDDYMFLDESMKLTAGTLPKYRQLLQLSRSPPWAEDELRQTRVSDLDCATFILTVSTFL